MKLCPLRKGKLQRNHEIGMSTVFNPCYGNACMAWVQHYESVWSNEKGCNERFEKEGEGHCLLLKQNATVSEIYGIHGDLGYV